MSGVCQYRPTSVLVSVFAVTPSMPVTGSLPSVRHSASRSNGLSVTNAFATRFRSTDTGWYAAFEHILAIVENPAIFRRRGRTSLLVGAVVAAGLAASFMAPAPASIEASSGIHKQVPQPVLGRHGTPSILPAPQSVNVPVSGGHPVNVQGATIKRGKANTSVPKSLATESEGARSGAAAQLAAAPSQPTQLFSMNLVDQTNQWTTDGPDGAVNAPDGNLAAGPKSAVEVTNATGSIWGRSGGLISEWDMNTWLGVPSNSRISSPRITYDPGSSRFFIAASSVNPVAQSACVYIAASQSSDPTSGWNTWTAECLAGTNSTVSDLQISVTSDKVLASWNEYNGNSFQGSTVYVWNKSQLTSGLGGAAQAFGPDPTRFSLAAADQVTATAQAYLTFNAADTNLTGQYNGPSPIKTPPGDNFTPHVGVITIAGAAGNASFAETDFSIRGTTAPPPAQQQGSSTQLDTQDDRFTFATVTNGLLWTGGTDGCTPIGDNTQRACLRFDEINLGSGTLSQDFDYSIPNDYVFHPSGSLDTHGQFQAAFNLSGSNQFPSLATAAQMSTTAPGTLSAYQLIGTAASAADYGACPKISPSTTPACQWGGMTSVQPDPIGGDSFWVTGAYNPTTATDWQTETAWMTSSPPAINGMLPPGGPTFGGNTITINGYDFAFGTMFKFGGVPATAVQIVNPNQAIVTVPPHVAGAVSVIGVDIAEGAGVPGPSYTYWAARSGGVSLDGFGGLHAFGNFSLNTSGSPYWSGWDIARAVVAEQDGSGGWVLDGYGGIHNFGNAAPIVSPHNVPADTARAMVMTSFNPNGTPNGASGYLLEGDGTIYSWGSVPSASAIGETPPAIWAGCYACAQGLAIHYGPDGQPDGGWVFDIAGHLINFGNAPALPGPTLATANGNHWDWRRLHMDDGGQYAMGEYGIVAQVGSGPTLTPNWAGYKDWSADDIQRDLQLIYPDNQSTAATPGSISTFGPLQQPASTGSTRSFMQQLLAINGGLILDGYGGIHPFGGVPGWNTTGAPYWGGWDIARDVVMQDNLQGGWTLDGYGGIHAFGNAPWGNTASAPYWGGWDIARALVMTSYNSSGVEDGSGGYVMDGWGNIHPFGNAPALSGFQVTSGVDQWRGLIITDGANGAPCGGYQTDKYGASFGFGCDGNTWTGLPTGQNGWGDTMKTEEAAPTGVYAATDYEGLYCEYGGPINVNWSNYFDWGGVDIASNPAENYGRGVERRVSTFGGAFGPSPQPVSGNAAAMFANFGFCGQPWMNWSVVSSTNKPIQGSVASNAITTDTTVSGATVPLDTPTVFHAGGHTYEAELGSDKQLYMKSDVSGWSLMSTNGYQYEASPGIFYDPSSNWLYVADVGLNSLMLEGAAQVPANGATFQVPVTFNAGGWFYGYTPAISNSNNSGPYVYDAGAGGGGPLIYAAPWATASWASMGWGVTGHISVSSSNGHWYFCGPTGPWVWCANLSGAGWTPVEYLASDGNGFGVGVSADQIGCYVYYADTSAHLTVGTCDLNSNGSSQLYHQWGYSGTVAPGLGPQGSP